MQADLVLALGEACGNAVEHAYAGREPGTLEVEIARGDLADELLLRVRDFGRWRDPSRPEGDRGRGTQIIRQLTQGFSRESGDDGTTVTFRISLIAEPKS